MRSNEKKRFTFQHLACLLLVSSPIGSLTTTAQAANVDRMPCLITALRRSTL